MVTARALTERYGEKTAVSDLAFSVRPGGPAVSRSAWAGGSEPRGPARRPGHDHSRRTGQRLAPEGTRWIRDLLKSPAAGPKSWPPSY